jgi:glutaryl-CoA dehydrogenase
MIYPDVGLSRGTDYFLLHQELSADEREYWDRARGFVDHEVLPVIADYWDRAEFPFPLVDKMATLDIVGDGIDGYGCPAMSPLAAGLVHMEINRGDGSLGAFLAIQSGLVMKAIHLLGSEEQRQRWLPGLARLHAFGAFGLTEPLHGSDSVALEATARRDRDEYVISGHKRWIGNASFADVTVVWARDSDDGQVKGFLVEKGTPGFQAEIIPRKASVRAVWQTDVTLTQARIPAENRLPGASTFKDAGRVLAASRNLVAWMALGHALAAYECALTYATERLQFGRPLAGFQLIQDKLVSMLAEVTAMQLYCFRLARLIQDGRLTDTIAALAKRNNARKARQVIADARDILGGNGILLDYHVMRHMADIEALYTFEGTDNIQTLIVGRDITGVGAFR